MGRPGRSLLSFIMSAVESSEHVTEPYDPTKAAAMPSLLPAAGRVPCPDAELRPGWTDRNGLFSAEEAAGALRGLLEDLKASSANFGLNDDIGWIDRVSEATGTIKRWLEASPELPPPVGPALEDAPVARPARLLSLADWSLLISALAERLLRDRGESGGAGDLHSHATRWGTIHDFFMEAMRRDTERQLAAAARASTEDGDNGRAQGRQSRTSADCVGGRWNEARQEMAEDAAGLICSASLALGVRMHGLWGPSASREVRRKPLPREGRCPSTGEQSASPAEGGKGGPSQERRRQLERRWMQVHYTCMLSPLTDPVADPVA